MGRLNISLRCRVSVLEFSPLAVLGSRSIPQTDGRLADLIEPAHDVFADDVAQIHVRDP